MKTTPLHRWIGRKIGCTGQGFDREALERFQLNRFQKMIGYVKERSPFYRQLFADLPEFPDTMRDLTKYPFTTPQDIQNDPNRFICVSQDEIERIVTLPTSGTTGPSKRIFFTAADQELTVDFFRVGMSTMAKSGDRVLILLPGQRPGSVGDLLRLGLERLGCIPIPYGPVDEEGAVLELIRDRNINVLVGAPVQLHRLARWNQAYHILPDRQIRSVLTSTDTLSGTIRANLQKIWGCEVFDHYGMTETGLGGGVECASHQGYHLREADLYYEVINPQSGQPVEDGDIGEVVVTTLTRAGMPLVRYRTGDLSRILSGLCPCGSFIRRLERIKTRIGGGIRLDGGMVTQSDLDEVLFQMEGLLDFSIRIVDVSGFAELNLALRFVKEIPENDLILDILRGISVIRIGLDDGSLRVKFSQMEDTSQTKTGYMAKRVLLDERKTKTSVG